MQTQKGVGAGGIAEGDVGQVQDQGRRCGPLVEEAGGVQVKRPRGDGHGGPVGLFQDLHAQVGVGTHDRGASALVAVIVGVVGYRAGRAGCFPGGFRIGADPFAQKHSSVVPEMAMVAVRGRRGQGGAGFRDGPDGPEVELGVFLSTARAAGPS